MSRIAAILLGLLLTGSSVSAQQTGEVPSQDNLRDDALAVSGRFARFERLLSQMADLLAVEDPDRAELLRRAISQSRENAIGSRIEEVVQLIGNDSLGDAIERQETSAAAMAELLKLLQSEDRRSAVERERERLDQILRGVRDTITQQRSARAIAQNSRTPSNASREQQKALERTGDLLNDIQQHDDAQAEEQNAIESGGEGSQTKGRPDGDDTDSERNASDQPAKDPDANPSRSGEKSEGSESADDDRGTTEQNEKSEKDPADESSGPSETDDVKKPGDPESGDSPEGKPAQPSSDSKSSGQQSQSGQQQGKSKSSPQTPGKQQLQQAQQRMQQALEELQKQQREEAIDEQDEAIAELEEAARELEELLKQLREEEKEMVLAALEARFQRLLAVQTRIYETTVSLGNEPREQWLDTAVSECRELAQEQAALTADCAQTTALLREDGTSVAIVVAVEDIEADMATIAGRLRETKAGRLTQSMETDVIEALKELIEATQKEMQDMKSEQHQQQQQQQQNQKKPDLVDLMAEIRVLRSLQLRVNRRTRQVHDLLQEGDLSEEPDLLDQLAELAHRQERLKESAAALAERMQR